METSVTTENRKRPLQLEEEGNEETKQKRVTKTNETIQCKILIPHVIAGAVIGKGGETIEQLQRNTGIRMKMSKSQEFFPGTTERVCTMEGSVNVILHVMDFIIDKMNDVRAAHDEQSREKQVKMLVSNNSASVIIGKGGSYIRQVIEMSGSYVQISHKDRNLPDRCVLISGEKDGNLRACRMILNKIIEDSGSNDDLFQCRMPKRPVSASNKVGNSYAIINNSSNLSVQMLDKIKLQLRSKGYSDAQVLEIYTALLVLLKNGILAMNFGLNGNNLNRRSSM